MKTTPQKKFYISGNAADFLTKSQYLQSRIHAIYPANFIIKQ